MQEGRHIARETLLGTLIDDVEKSEDDLLVEEALRLYDADDSDFDNYEDDDSDESDLGGSGRHYFTASDSSFSPTSTYSNPYPQYDRLYDASFAHPTSTASPSPSSCYASDTPAYYYYQAGHFDNPFSGTRSSSSSSSCTRHDSPEPESAQESDDSWSDSADGETYEADDEDTLGNILAALHRNGSYRAPHLTLG